MVEENLALEEPEEEDICLLVPARRRTGQPIRELDFNLIVDLVAIHKTYKNHIEQNLDLEMVYCMWKSEMRKNREQWQVFIGRVRPKVDYRWRRSWRYQNLKRLKPVDLPTNQIPLTVEAGQALHKRLEISDAKLAYLKQKYSDAVEKAYRHGFSVTVMAKAIGVNMSALRREMIRHMEWYALAEVRQRKPEYIWEKK